MNIQIFGTNKCFDTKKAQRYFKERGLTDETIIKFGLGFAPDSFFALTNYLLEKGFTKTSAQAISEELEIPYIITTDSHYARPEDKPIHKAYLNSKGGEREVDSFYEYSYLQTEDEIFENLRKSFNDDDYVNKAKKLKTTFFSF